MIKRITARTVLAATLSLAVVVFAVAWAIREDPADRPYLQILGGGFIFNYRIADVFYGFTVQLMKPIGFGSAIEAQFEDPGGGPPLIVSKRLNRRTTRYALRSPGVRGVQANRPYKVVISLYDPGRRLVERQERSFTSKIGDKVVPDLPLTVGPGYHRPPVSP
jgi:hypothetical protein